MKSRLAALCVSTAVLSLMLLSGALHNVASAQTCPAGWVNTSVGSMASCRHPLADYSISARDAHRIVNEWSRAPQQTHHTGPEAPSDCPPGTYRADGYCVVNERNPMPFWNDFVEGANRRNSPGCPLGWWAHPVLGPVCK